MIAKIAGFDTRAELGLRAPTSRSTNIHAHRGGVMTHYWGVTLNIRSHEDCRRIWRNGQKSHMAKNWVDIAYTAGFCDHGYVLAGRGEGVRTAANGTDDANNRYYAFVYIGGPGNTPTPAALSALRWLIAEARQHDAGREVKTHSDVRPTSCAGKHIIAETHKLNGSNISTEPAKKSTPASKPAPAAKSRPTVRNGSRGSAVKIVQSAVGAKSDGIFGPVTERAVKVYQRKKGLSPDGIVGPKTWKAIEGAPAKKAPAKAPAKKSAASKKLKVDGIWGPATTEGLQLAISFNPANGRITKPFREAFQWWLGVKIDGVWGPATRRALQRRLGVKADGVWGPVTVRALQRAINNNKL